jgi:hypothetical protein
MRLVEGSGCLDGHKRQIRWSMTILPAPMWVGLAGKACMTLVGRARGHWAGAFLHTTRCCCYAARNTCALHGWHA